MAKKQIKNKPLLIKVLCHFIAICAVGAILVFLTLGFLNVYTRHGHSVAVPKLEGLQVAEASAILRSMGLHVEIVDSIYQRNAVPGAIIEQTPRANNKVKEGRAIYITVFAQNPPQLTIPSLEDYSTRQAVALLESMGFNQITIDEVPAQHAGLVIALEYRGRRLTGTERVPAGAPLRLIVSRSANDSDGLLNNSGSAAPQSADQAPPPPPARNSSEGGIDNSFF